jgi:hypothetical protein
MTVILTLEPTSDGDDAFPTWLANSDQWLTELTSLANRPVRLHLMTSMTSSATRVDSDGLLIAELSWRDPWA